MTKAELAQLKKQIRDVLADDHPQSVRHIFYRMTDPRLPFSVEKSDRGYAMVQRQLAAMREQGSIPYGWISDTGRLGYHVNAFENAADFVRQMAGAYRADIWRASKFYVEVWCESRSIAGVILPVCREFGVSLYPSGGFTSLTQPYEAAEQISAMVEDSGRLAHIFYIGDYDPAGVLIDRDIEAKLRGHLGENVALEFDRIAINRNQIDALDLPAKPRKEGDKRSKQVEFSVEAESMPAGLLRSLLRWKIGLYLPEAALEVAKAAEESERAYLRRWADAMGEASP